MRIQTGLSWDIFIRFSKMPSVFNASDFFMLKRVEMLYVKENQVGKIIENYR